MNNVRLFFVLLLVGFMQLSYAQSTLKAKIIDEAGAPVEVGNILILQSRDSSLITGDYFLDGQIDMNIKLDETVLVQINSLGFKDHYQLLEPRASKEVVDLGVITLINSNTLGVVEVVSKRALFEKVDGGVRMNVENTILGNSADVNELLSKTPNVDVSTDGVNVIGKGNALIYLNDQQISIDQFRALSVSQIASIKVINNPSARYEAEGRAVIQVLTRKNTVAGAKGSIKQLLTQSRYFSSNSAINLDFKKAKWSINTGYEFNIGKDWSKETFKFEIPQANILSDYEYEMVEKTRNNSIYRAGITYDFNDKDYISASYNGRFLKAEPDLEALTLITENLENTSISSVNEAAKETLLNSVNLNVKKGVDSLGSSLFLGGQYSIFDNKRNDLITDEFLPNASTLYNRVVGQNKINIISSRLDFEKIFRNQSTFEVGGKFSNVFNDGLVSISSKDETEPDFTEIPELSNDFEYDETIFAGYTQYGGSFKKFNYSLGVRLENTNAKGFSNKLNQTIIDSSYLNFFPNADISFPVDSTKRLSFNYASSIGRPVIQDLDPFVSYVSSFFAYLGNPTLLPSLTHDVSSTLSFGNKSIGLGYRRTNNAILYVTNEYDPAFSSVQFVPENIGLIETYYLSASAPFSAGIWSSYNSLLVNLDIRDNEAAVKGSLLPWVFLYTYQQVSFKKGYSIELTGRFRTKSDDNVFKRGGTFKIDVGVSKSFFDNKLDISLVFNDIFNSLELTNDFDFNGITSSGSSRSSSQFVRLSLNYRFGKMKASNYKNDAIDGDEINRVKE